MVPFLNRPLVDYLLDLFAANGLHDIVLTTEHASFVQHLEQRAPDSLRIRYCEPRGEWRGTANCVREVVRSLGHDVTDPYIVVYGDSLLRADLVGMAAFHQERGADVTILYHKPDFSAFLYEPVGGLADSEPRTNYGVMEQDSVSSVTCFIEKPTLQQVCCCFRDPIANAAVYVVSRGTLDRMDAKTTPDFAKDVFPELLRVGMRVLAFPVGEYGYREDVGTLDRYLDLHMRALAGEVGVAAVPSLEYQGIRVAADASVAGGASLSPPVAIGRLCSVNSGARLEHCCLGDRVRVSEDATVSFSVVHSDTRIGKGARVERCLIGAQSYLGPGVVLPPGTVVGAHSYFGHPRITGRGDQDGRP